ncbi:MAG: stage V sporulation protein AA [Firmicutes bacterium]|nr:stage V sporulation protein AA [Bacillota bacterium]
MDIYIKPVKKAALSGTVRIGDIADVFAQDQLAGRVKNLKLTELKENKNRLVSVMDIIERINAAFPGSSIINVGESDTVIEYADPDKKENRLWSFAKAAAVTVMLAAGSATAIMSFHSDAQMSKVFENYYYIFFGEHAQNPVIIHLPYSIGLAVGIIVFFNHFAGKKLTGDPTPIEVEMSVYEGEVTDNQIDTLNEEKNKNGS